MYTSLKVRDGLHFYALALNFTNRVIVNGSGKEMPCNGRCLIQRQGLNFLERTGQANEIVHVLKNCPVRFFRDGPSLGVGWPAGYRIK